MLGRRLLMRAGSSGPADPNYANLDLLITGNGTNGGTGTDQSPTPKTLTWNSGLKLATTQVKWPAYATSIDAPGSTSSNGYISTTYTRSYAGAFFIDCWVYPTAFTTGAGICSIGDYNTTTGLGFLILGSGKPRVSNVNGVIVLSSTALNLNSWNYLALTRDTSNNVSLGQNGSLVASGTSTDTFTVTSSSVYVAGALEAGSSLPLKYSYMNDFRLYNGITQSVTSVPTYPAPTH